MGNYYLKVTITSQIEVVDCETLQEAKNYIIEQIKQSSLPDYYDIEIEEN